jgi:hypothetical protein
MKGECRRKGCCQTGSVCAECHRPTHGGCRKFSLGEGNVGGPRSATLAVRHAVKNRLGRAEASRACARAAPAALKPRRVA